MRSGAGGAPRRSRMRELAGAACAADLLGNPGYTVRTVVRILGYASPSHLAGAARRVAGATPPELRGLSPRGGLQRVFESRTPARGGGGGGVWVGDRLSRAPQT